MDAPEILTYRIEVIDRDHDGYGHTYITIAQRSPRSVLRTMANCAKDPSYYGEPDRWVALAKMGHDTHYRTPYEQHVTLHWQHYTEKLPLSDQTPQKSYCQHRIGKCERLSAMQWACKLLVGVSRDIAKAQGEYYGPKDCYQWWLNVPWLVVEALERKGAQRIELAQLGGYAHSEWVDAFSPLPVWRGKEEEAA